jgi:ribosomal protein S18 acetylase RimI-like enzyme
MQNSNNLKQQKPNDIEIKLVKSWATNDIVELYKAGGWWREHYDPTRIPNLIKGSFAFAVALNTSSGKAIGMGRVISDGVSDGYIQDVVVLPSYRGMGIGVRILKTLLNYCLENKLQWIGLIAEPKTKSFYSPLGFKELPGEPMVYLPPPEE